MINIIVTCTPNYQSRNIINTVNKQIDIVSQFVILYNSIQKNWNFSNRINLFYNKKHPLSEADKNRLSKLDIDIYAIDPDSEKTPYMLRCNALIHSLKNSGTHRLLLDCDTIALQEPEFDLSCDWQAMYAGSVIGHSYYRYINEKFGYNLDLSKKYTGPLFEKYLESGKYENFFPHFNGGAFLIREELCGKFKEHTVPSYGISHDLAVPAHIRHIGVQYGASFALMKMSDNWKPFRPGFNFLAKSYDVNKFGKNKISLLHYCGTGGYREAHRHFGKEIEELKQIK